MTATNICYNFVGFRCSPPLIVFKAHLVSFFELISTDVNIRQLGSCQSEF